MAVVRQGWSLLDIQAVKATVSGASMLMRPQGEADSSMMIDTVLYSMSQMECYPTVRQRGVVTIPKEVRDGLHLEEGDQLKLTAETLE